MTTHTRIIERASMVKLKAENAKLKRSRDKLAEMLVANGDYAYYPNDPSDIGGEEKSWIKWSEEE